MFTITVSTADTAELQTAAQWESTKAAAVAEFEKWIADNKYYISGPMTRQALLQARDYLQIADSKEHAAESLAVLEKIKTFTLGNNPEGTRKIIYKGADDLYIFAKDFYMVQEINGIPTQWAPTKKMTHIMPVLSHDNTRVSELKLEKRVSESLLLGVLRGIKDKSGLQVRMGKHELGIYSDYTQYAKGDLHIHFESTVPDEQGVYYNYRLKLNARSAVKPYKTEELRNVYTKWFGPFINENEINWPTKAQLLSGDLWGVSLVLMLAGWGLSQWLNAGTGLENAGLLLGAIPSLIRPDLAQGPKNVPNWQDITQAKMGDVSHLVWKLNNYQAETVAYAKYSTKRELERTKQFSQIMEVYKMQERYDLLHFVYPEFLAEGLEVLPRHVQSKMKFDRETVSIFGNVRAAWERSEVPFIMSAIEIKGVNLRQWFGQVELLREALNNTPITKEEWDQVIGFFNTLHAAGFEHTDLANNLYLYRGPDGKLQVTLLDFEVLSIGSDDLALQTWEKRLFNSNMLEQKSDDLMPTLFDFD